MLSKMSLRAKMAMPVALVSVLFIVILFNVWLAFNKQEASDKILMQDVKPVMEQLGDGYRDLYQIMTYTTGIVLAGDNQKLIKYYKAEFADEVEKITSRLNSPQKLINSGFIGEENNAVIQDLRANLKKSLDKHQKMFNLNSGFKEHYAMNKDEFYTLFDNVRKDIKILSEQIETAETALLKANNENTDSTKLMMELGGFIAILLSAFLTWYLSGLIVAPIKRLNIAMKDISSGDGDLTARVEVETQDDIGQLANSFNLFVEKIHSTISEVIGASQEVRTEIVNLGTMANSISAGAVEQQQESDAVATAVHEMSATSETVSNHANEAALSSQGASDEASNAKVVLGDTVVSIQSLSTEIAQAGDVINTLESDVEDISSILDVIRGIADQTNLLALNAAIEAARAGEQGRGFAVVADEVRSLASKTQDSTGEIQNMIEKLQNGAQQAVKVMTSSQTNSEETVQQAEIAGNSLDAIVSAINVINDMNIQIATAATEQSQVSEDVNVNVQRIAENSHGAVEMVSNAEQACAILDTQCTKLDNLVAQFKV